MMTFAAKIISSDIKLAPKGANYYSSNLFPATYIIAEKHLFRQYYLLVEKRD